MRTRIRFPNRSLINWYQKNKRDLPWRRAANPYKTWISEIMLQQTQVNNVIPYFNQFMNRFPNLESLAEADETDVLRLWSGLGYYSRAKNLLKSAKNVSRQFKGHLPRDYRQLIQLPGIGPYTAGAILSIAYHLPMPILDGNVRRVLSRFFMIHDPKKLWELAHETVLEAHSEKIDPSDFNQSLMELGAMVCLPETPHCSSCPLKNGCQAKKNTLQSSYPQISTKQKAILRRFALALLHKNHSSNGQQKEFLIVQRSARRKWLKNLWEFPMLPISKNVTPRKHSQFLKEMSRRFSKNVRQRVLIKKPLGSIRHTITRHHLKIWVMEGTCEHGHRDPLGESRWIGKQDLGKISYSSIVKKAIALIP